MTRDRARTAGCGGRPRRAGSRRAACPRRPAALAELEERGGVTRSRRSSSKGSGVEVDADQGQEPPGLAVAGPEDLVVPVGVLPAEPLDRVDLRQRREEAGLEPLALLAERARGPGRLAVPRQTWRSGPAEDQPRGDQADGRTPPQMIHPMVDPPATFRRRPRAITCILRSNRRASIRKVSSLPAIDSRSRESPAGPDRPHAPSSTIRTHLPEGCRCLKFGAHMSIAGGLRPGGPRRPRGRLRRPSRCSPRTTTSGRRRR